MGSVLSFDGFEVSSVFSLSEVAESQSLWEEWATHPSVDPAFRMWEFEQGNVSPCVLVVRSQGRLKGMAIGYIKETRLDIRLKYWTVLRPRVRLIAILDRGLIAHERGVEEAIVRALLELLSRGIADYCHIACVAQESPLRKIIMSETILPHFKDTSGPLEPRWVLEVPSTYEEFLRSRSRNTREKIRRLERKLQEYSEDLTVSVQPGNDKGDGDLYEDVQKVFVKTYQHKLGLSPLSSPHAKMVWKCLSDLGRLVAVVTHLKGAPVSFAYAHVFKSTAMFGTPGCLPQYSCLKVGNYSILRLIEALCGTGVRELDYGLGYSQYKQTFGTRCSYEGHIRLFARTKRGTRLRALISTVKSIESGLDRSVEALGVKRRLRRYFKSGKS